jgi:hypothetical protein
MTAKSKPAPDPVFALIEAEKAARAAYISADEDTREELAKEWERARDLLFSCVPQTRAGILAYVARIGSKNLLQALQREFREK